MAAINSGMAGGVVLGLLAGTILVYRMGFGWRVPFLIVGVLSLVLGGVIQIAVREPKEQTEHAPNGGTALPSGGRRTPFQDRDFWLVWLVGLGTQYSLYLILSWLPFYLQEMRGLGGAAAGTLSSLMPLVAAPSGMLAGYLSDRLGTRRRIGLYLVPFATVAVALVGFSATAAPLYAGLVLYGLTGKLVLDPILVSMVSERTAGGSRAGALGILNFASTVSMVSAPALTGYLADVTGSFRAAFAVAVALGVIAAAAMFMTKERPVT